MLEAKTSSDYGSNIELILDTRDRLLEKIKLEESQPSSDSEAIQALEDSIVRLNNCIDLKLLWSKYR